MGAFPLSALAPAAGAAAAAAGGAAAAASLSAFCVHIANAVQKTIFDLSHWVAQRP